MPKLPLLQVLLTNNHKKQQKEIVTFDCNNFLILKLIGILPFYLLQGHGFTCTLAMSGLFVHCFL